jgi:sugar/nucleoside kinase (ribokinase family)
MKSLDLVAFGEVALDILLVGVDRVPRRWSVLGRAKAARVLTAGAAGYVAQCFARLGGRASIAGKIGNDAVGRFVLDGFRECGVSTKQLLIEKDSHTEISTVVVYENGNKSSIVCDILPLRVDEFDRESLMNGRAFHFAGYLLYPGLWGRRMISLFKLARRKGQIVSVDPQMCVTGDWSTPFQEILDHLDLLLLDEEEAKRIARKQRVVDAIEKLLKGGPKMVAVKAGRRGCIVGEGDRIRVIRPYRTNPISTIGAGDAFDAAFIYGFLQDWALEKIARFANVAAAISTTEYGCAAAIPRAKIVEGISERYYRRD